MGDLCLLSPLKRQSIENWIREVTKSYADGSLCRAVLSNIAYDPDDQEVCARPNDPPQSDEVVRISTLDKTSKPVIGNTTNTHQLPAVTFSYFNMDKHKKHDNSAVQMFGYSNDLYNEKNRDICDRRDDNKRFVIVDPQMITPSGHTAGSRKPVPKINENDSPQIVSRAHRESSFTYRKETKEFYAKCKLHSTTKNGFVISRSNFRNQGTWKNHSFLDLPMRFRHDAQKATRASQLSQHHKETATSAALQKGTDSNAGPRRNDTINPKMLTTAVWAW